MESRFSQQQVLDTDSRNTSSSGWSRLTQPVLLQRFENAAITVLLMFVYSRADFSWWLLVVLFLVPDVSIIAYTKGNIVGSRIYNLMHNYTVPVLIAIAGSGLGIEYCLAVALIWALHISIDRAVGYGLKYTSSFHHNHLSGNNT